MANISYQCNQGFYPIETKNTIICSPTYRCYMPIMVKTGIMASEEKSFENVDSWTVQGWMDDGQTMDTCLYYELTYELNQLRWAKTAIPYLSLTFGQTDLGK